MLRLEEDEEKFDENYNLSRKLEINFFNELIFGFHFSLL